MHCVVSALPEGGKHCTATGNITTASRSNTQRPHTVYCKITVTESRSVVSRTSGEGMELIAK